MRLYSLRPTEAERNEALQAWRDAIGRRKTVDPTDDLAVARADWDVRGLWLRCRDLGWTFAELADAGAS